MEAEPIHDSGHWSVAASEIGLSVVLACICWLAEFVGLGFLISAKYLLPLTVAFLVLAVGALAFGAKHRHGYGPLLLGIVSAVGVLVGKFAWESNPMMYATVGLLLIASVWNAWPHRLAVAPTCCAEKSIKE